MNDFFQKRRYKTALVTGSTRGIGKAVASLLGRSGVDIIVHGSQKNRVDETVKELCGEGVNVLERFSVDFSKSVEVVEMAEQIRESRIPVDILVHSAGVSQMTSFEKMSDEEYYRLISINLTAPFLLTKRLIHFMKENNFGRIVFIGSVAGIRGRRLGAIYSASKSALNGLARSIARDFSSHNITANVVAPGYIETDMLNSFYGEDCKRSLVQYIPAGRLGTPHDVARLVAFLAANEAGYITGQVIPVDGGNM